MLCVKPEEINILAGEWRIYTEVDIPKEWMRKKMDHLFEWIITGIKS